jgi:putative ABC transport system ATP-binding protein
MLEIARLSKTFVMGGVTPRVALADIDLVVPSGQFVTIVGSNGAGKSTLLNAVAGVFPVDRGYIRLNGDDITLLPEHKRSAWIGRVFQNPLQGTSASMTVEENLAMACRRGKRRGLDRGVTRSDRLRIQEDLSLLGLGLENRLGTAVGLLSGGQRQALTLLMATMARPKLLLLDEHTAALDPKTAQEMVELTRQIVSREEGLTTLMVTHNLDHALRMGNRTIMMHEGEIVLDVNERERQAMTTRDLLQEFSLRRGEELVEDRILLAK